MRRLAAVAGSLFGALGVLAAVILFVALLGGGIYRTDCTLDNGRHIQSWGAEGDIPYLWSPGDNRCTANTLTRFVLGKIGVQRDLDS